MRIMAWIVCWFVVATAAQAQLRWSLIPTAISPPARDQAGAAFDGQGVLLFGGHQISATFYGDTWRWDGATWTRLQPQDSPPARANHAMVYDPVRGRVLLFGGYNDTSTFNDMWEWDGRTWQPLFPAWRPQPIYSPRMTFDPVRRRVVLLGFVSQGLQTWEWDGVVWVERSPPGSPRQWTGALAFDAISSRAMLLGNSNSSANVLQTWAYAQFTWSLLGTSPTPSWRTSSTMVLDEARRRVVLFGGEGGAVNNHADTWEWDGSAWSSPSLSGTPGARGFHALAYDPVRRCIVLFGGSQYVSNRTYFTDTWELANPNLGDFATFGVGCAGSAGIPHLDVTTSGSLPNLGEALGLRLTSLPPGNPAFAYLGFSKTTWNGGTLPIDLGLLGAPGCLLRVSAEFLIPVPNLGGTAPLSLPIPDDTGLLGIRFYLQGWVADPTANALGVAVTNGAEGLIGRR